MTNWSVSTFKGKIQFFRFKIFKYIFTVDLGNSKTRGKIVLFFCLRGKEGQRQLKETSFKFEVDASGRRFVTMAHDEATKSHPGGVSDAPSSEKLARIYKTPEENDIYKALKFYMAKLNLQWDAFF